MGGGHVRSAPQAWTTSWPSWIATDCRLTAAPADVCDPGDMRAKFEAFGWDVHEVDGHDIAVLVKTLAAAKADRYR